MPACAAISCNSGYRRKGKIVNSGLSYFKFPINKSELLAKWMSNLNRQDYYPTKRSVLCAKHFTDDCFIKISSDSNQTRCNRKRKQPGEQNEEWQSGKCQSELKRPRLKTDAIPTLFEIPKRLIARESSQETDRERKLPRE